eukprot:5370492-Pleurochrysis_carterae.AAC.1
MQQSERCGNAVTVNCSTKHVASRFGARGAVGASVSWKELTAAELREVRGEHQRLSSKTEAKHFITRKSRISFCHSAVACRLTLLSHVIVVAATCTAVQDINVNSSSQSPILEED